MQNSITETDQRILGYIQAANRLKNGDFEVRFPIVPMDKLGQLGEVLQQLAASLERRYKELQKLNQLTSNINSGLLLEETLTQLYESFQDFIPYDRLGFSLLEDNGQILRAHWARAEYPGLLLSKDYRCEIAGSSLETILNTAQPRIINDLEDYLDKKPGSESTQLIVQEGIRSSLSCPLIANGVSIGFIFFSSRRKNAYANEHVEIYRQIAGQLSVIVEKGNLISQLAEQKSQLERQYNEVKRLNELQNTFLGIAAHDLRNPIASIQNIAELLLMPEIQLSKPEKQEFFEDIRSLTKHMLLLLNDLLDVTNIESGKFSLMPIFYGMDKLLKDAVKRNQFLADAKKTQIILESLSPGKALIDIARMRQVLDNLISNAVKYSPPKSTIRIRAKKHSNCWRVEIEDQGPGIPPEEYDRLFKDFSRLSSKPTGGEQSTGLGLSITRRVIEAHHGSIGVVPNPVQGATFWFEIPIERNDQEMCS